MSRHVLACVTHFCSCLFFFLFRHAALQSRERLNNAWSAVQRSTYYKSLDRRSLDLKHEDKKAHVPKGLVADIAHR